MLRRSRDIRAHCPRVHFLAETRATTWRVRPWRSDRRRPRDCLHSTSFVRRDNPNPQSILHGPTIGYPPRGTPCACRGHGGSRGSPRFCKKRTTVNIAHAIHLSDPRPARSFLASSLVSGIVLPPFRAMAFIPTAHGSTLSQGRFIGLPHEFMKGPDTLTTSSRSRRTCYSTGSKPSSSRHPTRLLPLNFHWCRWGDYQSFVALLRRSRVRPPRLHHRIQRQKPRHPLK